MPRIPVYTNDDTPPDVIPMRAGRTGRTGKLASIHAEMAHAPAMLSINTGIGEASAGHGGPEVPLAPTPPGEPAVGPS